MSKDRYQDRSVFQNGGFLRNWKGQGKEVSWGLLNDKFEMTTLALQAEDLDVYFAVCMLGFTKARSLATLFLETMHQDFSFPVRVFWGNLPLVEKLYRNWRRILQAQISTKPVSFYESCACLTGVFLSWIEVDTCFKVAHELSVLPMLCSSISEKFQKIAFNLNIFKFQIRFHELSYLV